MANTWKWKTEVTQSGTSIIVHARRDTTANSSCLTHARRVRTEKALRRAISRTDAWCAKKNAKEFATEQALARTLRSLRRDAF
jgi:hypothetical protein